jgi:hypothetical protein
MNPVQVPSMVSQGQLLMMLLGVLGGILAIVGFVLWAAKHAYEERLRLRCPAELRMASVLFSLAPDGKRKDVLRCSLSRDRPVMTCGKPCLLATART